MRRTKRRIATELDHEDAETLAAIDEGLRDIQAGRVLSETEVREWLCKQTLE
jgi:predicted transcriptional regulator